MNPNNEPQSTLIEGLIEIPALPFSNLKIMHRIASDLNIEGFTVKKINVFEDPLIANIEIENTSSIQGKKSKSLFSRNAKFKDVCQRIYIYLTLTDFTRLTSRQQLTYSIKVEKIRINSPIDTSIMNVAHSVKDRLVLNFNRPQQQN